VKKKASLGLGKNSNKREIRENNLRSTTISYFKSKIQVSKQERLRNLKSAPFQTSITKISFVDTQKVHKFRRSLE
jgi:hypothetical protein